MQNGTSHIEPLFQTPEQRAVGTVTFRVFIDGAWRNIEGRAEWKNVTSRELTALIEQAYLSQKQHVPSDTIKHY
jgi:hypothetical protein